MKLSTSLVAVKRISSTVPRSKFSEDDLNRVAELILQAEGIINPPVIRRTSLESYEVVDGDFEYYAAAKAREIDPRKGEMIGAFIIEPENEEVLKQQVKVLRERNSDDDDTKPTLLKQFESLPQQVENLTVMLTQVAESVKQIQEIVFKQPELKPAQIITTGTQQKDYNSMTVKELNKEAKILGIKKYSQMKRPQLLEEVKKADASSRLG